LGGLAGFIACLWALACLRRHRVPSAVLAVAVGFSGSACAETPKAVECPVGKPQRIPNELKATFSTDEAVPFEAKRKELAELSEKPKDEECMDALRWLLHQPAYRDEVREEAFKLLSDWGPAWLFDDVQGMIADVAQGERWRGKCVKFIGDLHISFPAWDKKTYDALVKYGAAPERFLRDPALLAEGRLVFEYLWRRNHPERYAKVVEQVGKALGDQAADSVVNALKAVAAGELAEKAPEAERLAGDEKQPVEVRCAALEALAAVARPESLAVVDAVAKPGRAALTPAVQKTRPYALVAQLGGTDLAAKEAAYKELSAMGAAAQAALEKATEGEETPKCRMAKTLLGNLVLAQFPLKPVERLKLKPLGANPAKNQPGNPTILLDKDSKLIVVESEFALENGPLEYSVVAKGENAKMHETVVATHASPTNICMALLFCGYIWAGELRQDGKVNLPKGAGVMLSVEFEREAETPRGAQKSAVRVPLEAFIYNCDTRKTMKRAPWAFTGSRYQRTDDGRKVLVAEINKLVAAIMVDPDAILNTPLDTAEFANVGESRKGLYIVNRCTVPKKGTACSLIFEPWTDEGLKPDDIHDLANDHVKKPEETPRKPTPAP
jgi:hypothetical protein